MKLIFLKIIILRDRSRSRSSASTALPAIRPLHIAACLSGRLAFPVVPSATLFTCLLVDLQGLLTCCPARRPPQGPYSYLSVPQPKGVVRTGGEGDEESAPPPPPLLTRARYLLYILWRRNFGCCCWRRWSFEIRLAKVDIPF